MVVNDPKYTLPNYQRCINNQRSTDKNNSLHHRWSRWHQHHRWVTQKWGSSSISSLGHQSLYVGEYNTWKRRQPFYMYRGGVWPSHKSSLCHISGTPIACVCRAFKRLHVKWKTKAMPAYFQSQLHNQKHVYKWRQLTSYCWPACDIPPQSSTSSGCYTAWTDQTGRSPPAWWELGSPCPR